VFSIYLLDEVDELLHLVDILFLIFLLQVELRLPELHLQGFRPVSEDVCTVEQADALLSVFHLLVADVPNFTDHNVSFAFALDRVLFDLERDDLACLGHHLAEFFLSHVLGNVPHKNV